jgi:hypothetical protein
MIPLTMDSLTASWQFTDNTFGGLVNFLWGIHPMCMVDLTTKNMFQNMYKKLAKLELCSDLFSGLLCQSGVLNKNPTISCMEWDQPLSMLSQSDNTLAGLADFLSWNPPYVHSGFIDMLCWRIQCQRIYLDLIYIKNFFIENEVNNSALADQAILAGTNWLK